MLCFLFTGQTGAADARPSTLQDVAQALGLSVAEGGSGGPGTGRTHGPVDMFDHF